MKYLAIALLALVAACATVDQAMFNRDALGTAQSIWVDAQRGALAYRARPACPAVSPSVPCRNPATYRKMQEADRVVVAAVNKAKLDLEQNPSASSTKLAIDAALAAAKSYLDTVKEAN